MAHWIYTALVCVRHATQLWEREQVEQSSEETYRRVRLYKLRSASHVSCLGSQYPFSPRKCPRLAQRCLESNNVYTHLPTAAPTTSMVEKHMEETKQAVEQRERLASTPLSPHVQAQRSGYGRVVLWVTILLLGLGAGILAWQHLETSPAEVQSTPVAPPQPSDLAIVSENQRQQITVAPVGEQQNTVERETTGKVSFNEERLTPVVAPYAGRVLEVSANKGADVRPGQPLLVLESPELVATQNDLAAARSDVAKARIGLDATRVAAERTRGLHAQGAIATKDLQQAETELARAQDEQRRAQAALAAVEHRLALFGKSPEEIGRLDGHIDRRVVIRAPIGGTV